MPERWNLQRWMQNDDGTYSKRYYNRNEVNITAAAAELAEELGVDVTSVEGSGAEGRITKSDVEEAAASK